MKKEDFDKLKKAIEKAMGKTHLAGIKAEALHEHLRAGMTNLHFKWIEKDEKKVEVILEALKTDIAQHFVTKAESEEHKAVHYIVKELYWMYATMHSIMLFEKHDINGLGVFAQQIDEYNIIFTKLFLQCFHFRK